MTRPGRRNRGATARPASRGSTGGGAASGRQTRGTQAVGGAKGGRGGPVEPVPLETGRARGVLTGLFLFATGFAVAAVDLFVQGVARPVYLVAVTVGFVGIGIVGFFVNRGTVPRPEAALWSPTGLRALARSVRLPASPVIVVFYALVAVGIVGNFVVPLFFRR